MLTYRFKIAVSLFLILATLTVFWQATEHDFVNYDDDTYVTDNPHVQAGLTAETITWAFTTTYANFWHPLTWLSHMMDYQLFGLTPGRHHLSSLLLHTLNSILLFLVLVRMTKGPWCSALVASLFALHPLHVESVAWVSERKDVLSTLFWMLTMMAYVRYVEGPGVGRYLSVIVFYVLGLMAKPMLLTLPFVLLLLDYWPLRRIQLQELGDLVHQPWTRSFALHLVWEKMPLLILTLVSSVTAYVAQEAGGAISFYPLSSRIANAVVSYAAYVGKTIWPFPLAIPYPYPTTIPVWKVAAAGLLLILVSALAIRGWRGRPYFAVGWFWYIGTLVPVSGLVQLGSFAMADRFTYVPLIGLFIVAAWGTSEVSERLAHRKTVLAVASGLVLFFLMWRSWEQVHIWQNSIVLFRHAVRVTSDNCVAHNNLGNALDVQGELDEAMIHYSEALKIKPDLAEANNNLGNALAALGRLDEAIRHYSKAVESKPDYASAHNNMGNALSTLGRLDEAIRHYLKALQSKPDYALAHNNLGFALYRQGKIEDAIKHYSEALRISPSYTVARLNLNRALIQAGKQKKNE